jgi:hypothetical protein
MADELLSSVVSEGWFRKIENERASVAQPHMHMLQGRAFR